jgi:hypothetical protein
MFESMLFLFVEHPYDGKRVHQSSFSQQQHSQGLHDSENTSHGRTCCGSYVAAQTLATDDKSKHLTHASGMQQIVHLHTRLLRFVSLTRPTCTHTVGDNVYIKDELYRVKKISLLYTEMIAMNGEVSRCPQWERVFQAFVWEVALSRMLCPALPHSWHLR